MVIYGISYRTLHLCVDLNIFRRFQIPFTECVFANDVVTSFMSPQYNQSQLAKCVIVGYTKPEFIEKIPGMCCIV